MTEENNPLVTIINAKKDSKLIGTQEYIDAQLDYDWISMLNFQMGPNCNLSCFHCYGDYGKHRKGLPNLEVVSKTLEQLSDNKINYITLTDGEAVREENKEALRLFCKASRNIPMGIITNNKFANTEENAISWIKFMKENGFNFENSFNHLQASFGTMYDVPLDNYYHLNKAIKEVYPNIDHGNHLIYSIPIVDINSTQERSLILSIVNILAEVFDCDENDSVTCITDPYEPKGDLGGFKLQPKKGSPFKIMLENIDPIGRGKNLEMFKERVPEKINPENLTFSPDNWTSMYITHDGNVSVGSSIICAQKQTYYGNILTEPLSAIKKRINTDPAYLAFRVGGAKFLYTLARQIDPNYSIYGTLKCEVCRTISSDDRMLDKIRQKIATKKDFTNTYREYVATAKQSEHLIN